MTTFWIALGFVGQIFFSGRFIVQWVVSERKRASVIPVAFWYFSLIGSLLLLAYSIWRRDAVFIIGQVSGIVIYIRNLVLIRRGERSALPPKAEPAA